MPIGNGPFELEAMTVLEDCKEAYRLLQEHPAGQTWRIRWVTCCTLLRTVSEVLKNIDLNSSRHPQELKDEIREFRKNIKTDNHAIYNDFIQKSSNLILHQYDIHAGQGVTVDLGEIIDGIPKSTRNGLV